MQRLRQAREAFNTLPPELQKKFVEVSVLDAYEKIISELFPLLGELPRGALGGLPPFPKEANGNEALLDEYIRRYKNRAIARQNFARSTVERVTTERRNQRSNNWPVESYWIPSTDTLNELESYEERFEFFAKLLHPERVPRIDTVYVSALAPAGATVETRRQSLSSANALAKVDYLQPGEDILDEVRGAADFVRKNYPDVPPVRVIPWIEGSGITLKRKEANSLYQIAGAASEQGQAPFLPETLGWFGPPKEENNRVVFPGVSFANVLDSRVFNALRDFMVAVAARPDIDEIIVDDHFGINLRRIDRNVLISLHPELRRLGSVREQNEWIRDRLAERIQELSNALAGVGAVLSVSVNSFDFETNESLDSVNPSQWRDFGPGEQALRANLQDVATWIERGSVTGQINIQLTPGENGFASEVIGKYSTFVRDARQYIRGLSREQVRDLPEITVSIYAEGTKWGYFGEKEQQSEFFTANESTGPQELEKIRKYLFDEPGNLIITRYGRTFRAHVVGFDYLDFTKVRRLSEAEEEK